MRRLILFFIIALTIAWFGSVSALKCQECKPSKDDKECKKSKSVACPKGIKRCIKNWWSVKSKEGDGDEEERVQKGCADDKYAPSEENDKNCEVISTISKNVEEWGSLILAHYCNCEGNNCNTATSLKCSLAMMLFLVVIALANQLA